MSSKSFPDPDAISIEEDPDVLKVMSWNLWWKFENYLERQKAIFSEIEKLIEFCFWARLADFFGLCNEWTA